MGNPSQNRAMSSQSSESVPSSSSSSSNTVLPGMTVIRLAPPTTRSYSSRIMLENLLSFVQRIQSYMPNETVEERLASPTTNVSQREDQFSVEYRTCHGIGSMSGALQPSVPFQWPIPTTPSRDLKRKRNSLQSLTKKPKYKV